MDFKLVSKNNLGAVTALLLVIILSQGQFFNFLLDTALGRAVLILFILFISYTNKILGIVCVLFIIIMFNNSDIGYMEGNTTMGSSMGLTNNKPASTHPALTPPPAPWRSCGTHRSTSILRRPEYPRRSKRNRRHVYEWFRHRM